jgi:hypothetical protein
MAIEGTVESGHTFASGDSITVALLNKLLEMARVIIPSPIGVADGGTGSSTVAGAQAGIKAMGYLECWVEYTDDGVAVTAGTLPVDSYVHDIIIHVTTAFNGTGTDLVSVGWSADPDALSTAQDVSNTGVLSPTHGANDGYNDTAQTVEVLYADANGDASTGKALVVVIYAQVTTEP